MAKYIQNEAKTLSINLDLYDLGTQLDSSNGKEVELPPLLVGQYGNDPSKKTVLVYGHYDVQPAKLEDGWESDPFTLKKYPDGKLVGRGVTDDKGPVVAWFNSIQAYQEAGVELPVNVQFCLEGMEESGSEGLEDFIRANEKTLFGKADALCISDNYWLGTSKPVLTYGLRGIMYYSVTISGPSQDLHSGLFGGAIMEPMTDLVRLLNEMVDPVSGLISYKKLERLSQPPDEAERALYDNIQFSNDDLHNAVGKDLAIYKDSKDTLMARWRYPALSIHGVEGAFSSPGAKTVIPAKVSGKFSIRTVPGMSTKDIGSAVEEFINVKWKELSSKNEMKLELMSAGKCWISDPNNWNFEAAKKATKEVWGVDPDFTREGGSIPVAVTFQEVLKKPLVLLPIGRGDDGAHSAFEKLDEINYIQGTKTMAAYLWYLSTTQAKTV